MSYYDVLMSDDESDDKSDDESDNESITKEKIQIDNGHIMPESLIMVDDDYLATFKYDWSDNGYEQWINDGAKQNTT